MPASFKTYHGKGTGRKPAKRQNGISKLAKEVASNFKWITSQPKPTKKSTPKPKAQSKVKPKKVTGPGMVQKAHKGLKKRTGETNKAIRDAGR